MIGPNGAAEAAAASGPTALELRLLESRLSSAMAKAMERGYPTSGVFFVEEQIPPPAVVSIARLPVAKLEPAMCDTLDGLYWRLRGALAERGFRVEDGEVEQRVFTGTDGVIRLRLTWHGPDPDARAPFRVKAPALATE
jgi:hypothetical protein